jgi:hypothetical protein
MITNEDYLIQKFSEAREKLDNFSTKDHAWNYWRGVMDTYHNLLSTAFPGWASYPNEEETGSVGYYVFYCNLTYDEALNKFHNEAINS